MIRTQFMYVKDQNPFDEFVHSFLIENKNKISVNKRNTQGAGNGGIPIKSQHVRPTSNNKQHQTPKTRPQYRCGDNDVFKQSF